MNNLHKVVRHFTFFIFVNGENNAIWVLNIVCYGLCYMITNNRNSVEQ